MSTKLRGNAIIGGTIFDAQLAAAANIAYSKLNLSASIDSGDYVDDSIDADHINWGQGVGQISASDVPLSATDAYYTTDTLQGVSDELKAQIGGATSTTYAFGEANVLANNDAIYSALNKLDLKWGDLASVINGEGASLVSVESGNFTGTNVEAVLLELQSTIVSVQTGTSWKNAVTIKTVGALSAYTYANGTAGVGATITLNANGIETIDGVAQASGTANVGDRLLISEDGVTNNAHSGIYVIEVLSATGAALSLKRATDNDESSEMGSAAVFIKSGSTQADTGWTQTVDAPTIGTTALVWSQFTAATLISILDDLTDVAITSATNGDLLIYSGSSFVNTSLSVSTTGLEGIAIASGAGSIAVGLNIAGLTSDATIVSTNQIITYDGTNNQRATVDVLAALFAGTGLTATAAVLSIDSSQTQITAIGNITTGTWSADTIAVSKGGTGLSSYATGDLLYASGTTVISALGIGTANQYLRVNGTANGFVWDTLDLTDITQIDAGTVNISAPSQAARTTEVLHWNQTSNKWQVYSAVYGEVPTVTNASADVTLANTPAQVYAVYLNGGRMEYTQDWTLVGAVITFTAALSTIGEPDKVFVDYIY